MSLHTPSIPCSDWLRVARAYSQADLKPHPDTDEIMEFFSDDAQFFEEGPYYIGKKMARIRHKLFSEWSVLESRMRHEPVFKLQGDHVFWHYSVVQLRKGIFPTWLVAPQWYYIDYAAELYFSGEGEKTKISKLVVTENEWELLDWLDEIQKR